MTLVFSARLLSVTPPLRVDVLQPLGRISPILTERIELRERRIIVAKGGLCGNESGTQSPYVLAFALLDFAFVARWGLDRLPRLALALRLDRLETLGRHDGRMGWMPEIGEVWQSE